MTNSEYKKEAQDLYKDKHLLDAYSCAWKLSFSDFIPWFTDVQGKRKKTRRQTLFNDSFFYNSFLPTQSSEWLTHSDSLFLWEYYLDTQEDILLEFELFVAHNNPSLFIEGYKNRLVFLDGNRLNQLQEKHLPLLINNEIRIWKRFNYVLRTNWEEVLKLVEESNLESYALFMGVSAAFEAFVYQNPDDKLRWHFAVEALSLLTSFIQSYNDLSRINVDVDLLHKSYFESVFNLNTVDVFNKCYDYVIWRDKVYRYVYEPGLRVTLNDNILNFEECEAFNKQWQHDELRYEANTRIYFALGERLFDELKNKNEVIFKNSSNKSSNNQLGNARQLAVKQALNELGITDEDLKNNKLPSLNFIISFMHGIAWRKLETSEEPLHIIARTKQNEYREGVAELFKKSNPLELILISDNDKLFTATTSTGLNFTKQQFHEIISAFSFNWKVKTFDPFKMPLSMWQKPYIKLGKFVVSPISVLTGFTGLYTISESILKNFRPREGRRIEYTLKNTYENENWNVSLPENNQENGDVDVLMEDDENIVFIQMKRTTQKTNMPEFYIQGSQDRKAIKQLLKAKEGNKSNKSIHLWYVTTAFEKVGTWEKGVYRVSYQDLIHIKRLLDFEGLRFNNLSSFIKMIESDTPYKLIKQFFLS